MPEPAITRLAEFKLFAMFNRMFPVPHGSELSARNVNMDGANQEISVLNATGECHVEENGVCVGFVRECYNLC